MDMLDQFEAKKRYRYQQQHFVCISDMLITAELLGAQGWRLLTFNKTRRMHQEHENDQELISYAYLAIFEQELEVK